MKAHKRIMILLFYVLPLPMSFAATPEQCYSYFTELVRSSSYPFNEWNVKPKEVNLMIDD